MLETVTTPAPETETVSFQVIGVEPVRGRGALIGLAIVEIDVAGVALTLQGVQLVRDSAGLSIRSPVFRHPKTGRWLPRGPAAAGAGGRHRRRGG